MRGTSPNPSSPKVFVKTYGCQMNVHDSERMIGLLMNEGFTPADSPQKAQVILINTCAVREKPERKLMAELGRLKKLKEQAPDLIIGVTGCMAPRDGELIRQKAPFVDLLLGPRSLHRLPELVRIAQRLRQPVEAIDLSDDPTPLTPIRRTSTISAWVDVIFGCSFACTFCAVPSARGPERSRLPEDILAEVAELKSLGYREITLLGQTVNAYGRDWRYRIPSHSRLFERLKDTRQRVDFTWLLREIDRVVNGAMRVRFTSPHPTLFSAQLIEAIADLPSLCEHIHLPLQSADDGILK
ncbi:MAG: MiaB/RimO family radical SAM methylthiotransferase, partial [bacterium]